MTSLPIEIDDGSWMQLTDMDTFDDLAKVFTFTNTKEILIRTVISMPVADATPAVLEALYHRVNYEYPESSEHLHELAPYLARLPSAKT